MDDVTRKRIDAVLEEAGGPLANLLRGVVDSISRTEEERCALPCQDPRWAAANRRCEVYETCKFARDSNICCVRRNEKRIRAAEKRLLDAAVPLRERNLVIDNWNGRKKLKVTGAITAVKAWVRRGAATMLVLSGAPSLGKTVAAAYALGVHGGLYTTAYLYARPDGVNLAVAKRTRTLVIDQLDFDGAEVPPYAAQQIREVIDARYAEQRRILLCCNQERAVWEKLWGRTIAERLAGDGQWVRLTGTSLRQKENGTND